MNIRRNHNYQSEVDAMWNTASLIGTDLIEVLWAKKEQRIPEVIGYQTPKIDADVNDYQASLDANATWNDDGVLKFFPDGAGNCWGYVFDTPKNREYLYSSFNTPWFSIVDKKQREEIMKEAQEKGYDITPAEHQPYAVKLTKREKEAVRHKEVTEKKLEEAEKKLLELQEEMKRISGEKASYENIKPLKKVKIKNREKVQEELKNAS